MKPPIFFRRLANEVPLEWINYVYRNLMNEALWKHYFFWEAYQVLKLSNQGNWHGLSVLEPGCGNGVVGCLLSLLGAKVTLLDYSDEELTEARRHAQALGVESKIRFIQGDIFDMNIPEKFDIVWNDGVIEHFPDPALVIKNMMKLANPAGRVLVTVPAKYTLHSYLIRPILRRCGKFYWDRWGEEKSYSQNQLKKILIESGLKQVEVITSNLRRAFLDDNLVLPLLEKNKIFKKISFPLFKVFDYIETGLPIFRKAGFVTAGIGLVN